MFTTGPISHRHLNSRSQPAPWVGNLNGLRGDIIPDSMGLSQPTSRGGNINGCRRDVIPADRLSRSVTQQTESGSSNSAESSDRNSSPPPITRRLLARPAKCLLSSIIQTTAYTEPEMEADRQGHMELVRLSDDSCDEYQLSHPGDETEPDTEPEGANLGRADDVTILLLSRYATGNDCRLLRKRVSLFCTKA